MTEPDDLYHCWFYRDEKEARLSRVMMYRPQNLLAAGISRVIGTLVIRTAGRTTRRFTMGSSRKATSGGRSSPHVR